jgi:NADH-quinone oxidoreductase subunit N
MSKELLAINLYAIAPILCCGLSAVIILIISAAKETLSPEGRRRAIEACEKLSFLTFITAALISAGHFINIKGPVTLFKNAIFFDHYAAAACFFFAVMGIFTLFMAGGELRDSRARIAPEYYALLLSASIGAMIMSMANDLIAALIGIEILSVSTYILCALDNTNKRAVEGAFKYFLTGAAASAIFIFGMAHIYGGAKTTFINEIIQNAPAGVGAFTSSPPSGLSAPLLIGLIFITAALLFKAAAVPFHNWAPDVYDAAPVSVAAFMTYFVKAAVFILIFRIFAAAFLFMAPEIIPPLVLITVITMTLANIAALFQNNIKRMLAYSSISHTAYILIAVICVMSAHKNTMIDSGAYILFYLISYFFINAAVFSALGLIKAADDGIHTINDLKGRGFTRPFVSAAFAAALLALAGIPATSGFMAKFLIFYNAFMSGYHALVLIAVINSFIAFYYYIKIIMMMYMYAPEGAAAPLPAHETASNTDGGEGRSADLLCLAVSAAMIIALGVYPGPVIKIVKIAIVNSF